MRVVAAILAATIGASGTVAAQSPDWSAILTIAPNPSPYLSDWERVPSTALLSLTYTGSATVDYRVRVTLTSTERGLIGSSESPSTTVAAGPASFLYNARDAVFDWTTVSRNQAVTDGAIRTGQIPEGNYRACARVLVGAAGTQAAEACADFSIFQPDPPQLVMPRDGDVVVATQPFFQWTPVLAPPTVPLRYEVTVVEVIGSQLPRTALEANIPVYREVQGTPFLIYPIDALPLERTKRYAWRVRAVDDAGQQLFRDGAQSEIWSFEMSDDLLERVGSTKDLPDTLVLLPGVAQLTAVKRARLRTGETEVQIEGDLQLEFLGGIQGRSQMVRTSGLRAGFRGEELTLLAGRVEMEMPEGVVPAAVREFVTFGPLVFTPQTGFRATGTLRLPGRAAVPLTGAVQLTAGGLFGRLEGAGVNGLPIASVGRAPVQYAATGVRLSFPEGRLEFSGQVRLFEQDIACPAAGAVEDGVVIIPVYCEPGDGFRPDRASARSLLTFGTLGGTLGADFLTDTLGTELRAPTTFTVMGDANPTCALDFTMVFRRDRIEREEERSRCAVGEAVADYGWVRLALSNLRITRLEYDPGQTLLWRALVDLVPTVRNADNLQLAPIRDVALTLEGVNLPSTSSDAPGTSTSGIVELAEVGVVPRTMGFRGGLIPYSRWLSGTDPGLEWGSGTSWIRFPYIGSASSDCLNGVPFEVDTLVFRAGRLDAALQEKRWEGGCRLHAAVDLQIRLISLGGRVGIALDETPRVTELPSITGDALTWNSNSYSIEEYANGTDASPLSGDLRLTPRGRVRGEVQGFAPSWGEFNLRFAKLKMAGGDLALGVDADGSQTAVYDGPVVVTVEKIEEKREDPKTDEEKKDEKKETSAADLAQGAAGMLGGLLGLTGEVATAEARIDYLGKRLLDGNVPLKGPFKIQVGFVTFILSSATLDTTGLLVDGRQRTIIKKTTGTTKEATGGKAAETTYETKDDTTGVTFARVRLDPVSGDITSGTVTFDGQLALESSPFDALWAVGSAAVGGLVSGGGAEAVGAQVSETVSGTNMLGFKFVDATGPFDPTGTFGNIRLNLPSTPTWDSQGIRISGNAPANVAFAKSRYDGATVSFENGFAMRPGAGRVTAGRALVKMNQYPIAYLEPSGWRLAIAELVQTVIPDTLFLFDKWSAYVVLRDAQRQLLVDVSETNEGPRIRTREGTPVRIVIPALKGSRQTPPAAEISMDLTLAQASWLPVAGNIKAIAGAGPDDDFNDPDFPFELDSVVYSQSRGADPAFFVHGRIDLFPGEFKPMKVSLAMLGGGELRADATQSFDDLLPLVSGSSLFKFRIDEFRFTAQGKIGQGFQWRIETPGRLTYFDAEEATESTLAQATFRLSPTEAALLDFAASNELTVISLPGVDLRLGRARAPLFRWDFAQRRFDFELLFDLGLQIPALDNLRLPEIRDISITPQGIHIPAFEISSVPVGAQSGNPFLPEVRQIRVGGFSVAALAYRVSDFRWNWFANAPPPQFNFGVDLEFGIEDLPSSLEGQAARIALRALNVGITNGRFTGSFEPIQIPIPIRTPVADIRGAYGSFAVADGQVPDIRIGLLADLRLPDVLACPDEAARRVNLDVPGDTLFLASNGTVFGSIRNVIPRCNMALGPLDLRFGTSTVRFGYDAPSQQVTAELAASVTLTVPSATPGATVSATGSIEVDLIRGRVTDASVAIDQPFFFAPDPANPFLRLIVSQASLTQRELRFGATGQIRTPEGAGVDVAFENVAFDLDPLRLKSGRIRVTADAAVGIEIPDDGSLTFGVYPVTSPRGSTASARLVLPSGATIDNEGVHINGNATASLGFGGETYASLVAEFANDFTIAFGTSVGISRGRLNLRDTGNQLIAYVDATGFWPGNVFAVLPIPERLGLPSVDVAYLQLRNPADPSQLLIETEFGAETVRLRTLPGQKVTVGLPALAAGGPVPTLLAEFDLVLNSRTMLPVSGGMVVDAAPGQSLVPIQGAPVLLTRLGFAADVGGFKLKAGLRASLPGPLAGTNLSFQDIVISAQGLTGVVELGEYSTIYNPVLTPIAEAQLLGDTLAIAFTGARLTLDGPNTQVQVSGGIRSALLKTAAGAPRVIHLGASIGPNGFAGTADLSDPEQPIPIGVAELTIESSQGQPGLAIVANAQEFSLTIGGSLRLPTIAPGFSLSVRDFTVGSAGVRIPDVSITAPANTAEFELFGARFALQDSVVAGQQVAPAIGIQVVQGAVRFELSGYITILQNTTRFIGLRFGTDGTFAIQGASFLSRPIDIVENYVRLTRAAISNNQFELVGDVTLPAPFTTQAPQQITLRISPQGQVTGGARVVVISEPEGIATARTILRAGVAAFHLRHLDFAIDFQTLANNAVSVVADVYIQEKQSNLLRFGKVVGGTVTPGVRVALNGDVTFGGLEMPGPIAIDLDPVQLVFTRITSQTTPTGFEVAINGSLGLKLDGASGSLSFTNLGFTSAGEIKVNTASINGGTFTIQDQVKVIVGQIAWGQADTSIYVPKALPPLSDGNVAVDSIEVDVSSFLRLGAQVEIAGVFKGGVRNFLVYVQTDQTTHLLIDRLTVQIPDVIDFVGSLKYDQLTDGFELALAAKGQLLSKFEIAMVGVMGQRGDQFRAGLFLRSSVIVPIIPGIVTLTGVGGGLFINPTANDLALVQGIAGFSGPSANRIGMPPAAAFAVMLYASVDIGGTAGAAVASGRAMVTITDQAFQLNVAATFLNRKDEITGDLALQVGWVPAVYVRGDVSLKIDIKKQVSGTANIKFFAGSNQFAVTGDVDMTIVEVIKSTAQVIIVPSGFTAKVGFYVGVKASVVEVGVSAMMRVYSRPSTNDLGAYVKLDGTVKAFGIGASITLIGALVVNPEFAIYAQGTAQVIGTNLRIDAWVQYTSRGPAAGLGQNEELAAVIANAEAIAAALEAEANQILAGIDADAQARARTPIAVSQANLEAAYRNFQQWNWLQVFQRWGAFLSGEAQRRGGLVSQVPSTDPYVNYYEAVLVNSDAAADTAIVRQLREEAEQKLAVIAARRAGVEDRIRALRLQLDESEAAAAFVPPADPVQQWDEGNPVLVPGPAGPDGKPTYVLAGAPRFALDDQLAGAAQAAMTAAQAATVARAPALRAQLAAVEAGLTTVLAATTASDPSSFASYARLHSDAVEAIEHQHAANVDFRMRRRSWVQGKLDTLALNRPGLTQRLNDRLSAITAFQNANSQTAWVRTSGTAVELDDLAKHRAQTISSWSGDPSIAANYESAAAEFRTMRSTSASALLRDPSDAAAAGTLATAKNYFQDRAIELGLVVWADVAVGGLTAARNGAQQLVDQANAEAQPVIRTMRDMHANITSQLAELNTRQAQLYGVLYDLYDNYLRTYGSADATGQQYLARKAVLSEMLQAPRVTNPTVTVTDFGYLSSIRTTWSGTHPRGVYEYLIQDGDDSLFTVGAQGDTRRWVYTVLPAGGRWARAQVVSVRGGAGLTGSTTTPYAVTFRQGSSSNPVTQVATPPVDLTAPTVPVVSFNGLRGIVATNGETEYWTGDASRIPVRWSATDPESGIAEYEYRVVTYDLPAPPRTTYSRFGAGTILTPIVPTPLTAWASAGGRTSMTIQGLTLPANRQISVEVRAKNGAGLTGAANGSPVLRYDPTPPAFASGATLAYGGRSYVVPSYFVIGGMLPPLQPVCQVIATFGATSPQPIWNGRLVSVTPNNAVVGGGAQASLLLGLPTATDGETGIAAYHYRVDVAAPTGATPTDGWTPLPVGGTSFTATGPEMVYGQARWISLVAENGAGGRSAPIVYGPVTVADPTAPNAPSFCADISSNGFIAYMHTPSVDAETGVRGYQMRVRGPTGAIVRDFPAGTAIDWPANQAAAGQGFRLANASASTQTTIASIGTASPGGRHIVELRAVNGSGAFGDVARSGEVLVDFSPPPVAGVTATYRGGIATLTLTIADDPESGIAGVDVAFGSSPTDPTLTGSSAGILIPYTTTRAGVGVSTASVHVGTSSPIYVYVRVRNGKGLSTVPTVARIR